MLSVLLRSAWRRLRVGCHGRKRKRLGDHLGTHGGRDRVRRRHGWHCVPIRVLRIRLRLIRVGRRLKRWWLAVRRILRHARRWRRLLRVAVHVLLWLIHAGIAGAEGRLVCCRVGGRRLVLAVLVMADGRRVRRVRIVGLIADRGTTGRTSPRRGAY